MHLSLNLILVFAISAQTVNSLSCISCESIESTDCLDGTNTNSVECISNGRCIKAVGTRKKTKKRPL